jgi:transposase
MEQLLSVIDPKQIEVVLADREFIGHDWFTFLTEHNIPFAIRIRENSLADTWFRLSCFFTTLSTGQHKQLQHRYSICGCVLAVAATRSADGQLVIIVTNRKPAWALRVYALRWQIERSLAWYGNYRRLARDYEVFVESSETFIYLASCDLMLKRLAGTSGPAWRSR